MKWIYYILTFTAKRRREDSFITRTIVIDKYPLEWLNEQRDDSSFTEFAILFAQEIDKQTFDKYEDSFS